MSIEVVLKNRAIFAWLPRSASVADTVEAVKSVSVGFTPSDRAAVATARGVYRVKFTTLPSPTGWLLRCPPSSWIRRFIARAKNTLS